MFLLWFVLLRERSFWNWMKCIRINMEKRRNNCFGQNTQTHRRKIEKEEISLLTCLVFWLLFFFLISFIPLSYYVRQCHELYNYNNQKKLFRLSIDSKFTSWINPKLCYPKNQNKKLMITFLIFTFFLKHKSVVIQLNTLSSSLLNIIQFHRKKNKYSAHIFSVSIQWSLFWNFINSTNIVLYPHYIHVNFTLYFYSIKVNKYLPPQPESIYIIIWM